ncbi:MAG TPA: bifunctional DNA-formamidopyrimidine glycosylase/DNA-(apurinic or apyrimidinic site) lyase [Actinomycetota bacterium]|nr:bifunctional DNA-formamidopyrimidine glycosylase/DNA-(apurinic or apyrimidinic site) lyase [Actinomycetota bacterium]
MPELPEVEVIRRDLAGVLPGATIAAGEVLDSPNARRVLRRHPFPHELAAGLSGATVESVDRHGKYLIVRLDRPYALVVHLGMSGRLLVAGAADPLAPHTHVVLSLADGQEVRYVDPRTFGELFLTDVAPDGLVPALGALGPDALDALPGPAAFAGLLTGRRTPVKARLMDQRVIAGLGNIYSDEALFRARVRPLRLSGEVTRAESDRLRRSIHPVLQAAIDHRGTSTDDEQYRDAYGLIGDNRRYLMVYGREGEPCARCGTPIVRARWTNRSTHFCPSCQK